MKTALKIIFLSATSLILTLILLFSLSLDQLPFSSSFLSQTSYIEDVSEDFTKLEIVVSDFDLEVKKGFANIEIIMLKDHKKPTILVNNNTLFITQEEESTFFVGLLSYITKPKIIITLPEELYQSFILTTVSGDIHVTDFTTLQSSFTTVSGNQYVSAHNSSKVSLVSISGNLTYLQEENRNPSVSFSGSTISGNQKINTHTKKGNFSSVSGNLAITILEPDSNAIELSTVSGNGTLVLPKDLGFSLSNNSISGDLHVNFNVEQNLYLDGSCRISLQSTSGNYTITH